jgi:hypothetical protein
LAHPTLLVVPHGRKLTGVRLILKLFLQVFHIQKDASIHNLKSLYDTFRSRFIYADILVVQLSHLHVLRQIRVLLLVMETVTTDTLLAAQNQSQQADTTTFLTLAPILINATPFAELALQQYFSTDPKTYVYALMK